MSSVSDFLVAQGGIVVQLSPLFAVLRVHGEDAEAFLQGQLTCDVKALDLGDRTYGAYCTAKGRVLANLLIWRQEDGFFLMLSGDIAEATRRRLQMFVLRAKVTVEIEKPAGLIGLAGEDVNAVLAAAGYRSNSHTPTARVLMLQPLRFLALIGEEQEATAAWAHFTKSFRPSSIESWQWLDIVQGVPWITAATQDQFVPQMINLEKIGGVSFKKGCYPGQEIVARTQYLGKANRRMHLVHSEAPVLAGQEIYAQTMGDQACGMVVNAVAAPQGGYDALVVAHHTALEGEVHAQSLSGPVLSFRPLPYPVVD
ncbi:MAG TPA: folate-binding protein YgfZ [Burkholderiales bacterium]|nr:folate-binding protein YgfZ [Burkholderiales bacterium]